MAKILLKFFALSLISLIVIIFYLTYYGVETDRFDEIIKKKANEFNYYAKLDFNKTNIHLNPTKLNLIVKLKDPKILIKNDNIKLYKLDLFLSIKSLFSSDFLLKKAIIAFEENDIKDLTKISNIFLPKFINKKLNKIFNKGKLEGEFVVPFTSIGKIGEDYYFSGKINNATINLTQEYAIKNLTTEINHTKIKGINSFKSTIRQGQFFDLDLGDSVINVKRNKVSTDIESILKTKGKFDSTQIKKLLNILKLDVKALNEISGTVDLKTNINFSLIKNFKIKDLSYLVNGNINNLDLVTEKNKLITGFLPDYKSKFSLKNTNITVTNSKKNQTLELNGFVKINDNFDNFEIKQNFNTNKKIFNINGLINLTSSKIKLSQLNYKKDKGIPSEVNFDLNFISNKYYNINTFNYSDTKSLLKLNNIKLDKDFQIKDFKEIKIKTFNNKIKNNDFSIIKKNNIIINGDVYDAAPLLKSLYKKNNGNLLSKNISSDININFNKTITGTNDDLKNLSAIASLKKGKFNKLSLKGNFSENEIIEMSIYQIDKDKKTLHLISDRARPFIKNFDFVKGFEGGKLEYETITSQEISNSNLIITDFKVSKVPALAQLLTLASLQGIADTLSGEGIRFDSFEMKSNSKENVLNIEDALAMGPAVSILLSGYVDKGNIVSLRGTLVPATKLNSIISSIPVVGEILVGKKTGEGVVGVSFKMKGPPKDIKTTVNPIKTLTPRFIVRAFEKMKKEKKKKIK